MMRNVTFVKPRGTAVGCTSKGQIINVPLIPGILKHLTLAELEPLLQRPSVLEKYTYEALRWAPWQCLREFPIDWLRVCLAQSDLRPGRRQAIEYLLDIEEAR